ncbi:5240_t:CDS:1, partial [Funneliformis geosporum]
LQQKCNDKDVHLQKYNIDLQRLQQKFDNQTKNLQDLQQKCNDKDVHLQELQQKYQQKYNIYNIDLQRLQQKCNDKDVHLQDLQQKYNNKFQELQRFHHLFDDQSKALIESNQQKEHFEKCYNELKQHLDDKETRIKSLKQRNGELENEAAKYQSALGVVTNFRMSDDDKNHNVQLNQDILSIQDKIDVYVTNLVKSKVDVKIEEIKTKLVPRYKCQTKIDLKKPDKLFIKAVLQRYVLERILKFVDNYFDKSNDDISMDYQYLESDIVRKTGELHKVMEKFASTRDGTDEVTRVTTIKLRQLIYSALGMRGLGDLIESGHSSIHQSIQKYSEQLNVSMNKYRVVKDPKKKEYIDGLAKTLIREIFRIFHFRLKVQEPIAEYYWFNCGDKVNKISMKLSCEDDDIDDLVVDLCTFPLIGQNINPDKIYQIFTPAKVFACHAPKPSFINKTKNSIMSIFSADGKSKSSGKPNDSSADQSTTLPRTKTNYDLKDEKSTEKTTNYYSNTDYKEQTPESCTSERNESDKRGGKYTNEKGENDTNEKGGKDTSEKDEIGMNERSGNHRIVRKENYAQGGGNNINERDRNHTNESDRNYRQGGSGHDTSERVGNIGGIHTSESDGNYYKQGIGGNYTQGKSSDTSEKDGNYAQGRSGNQSEKDRNFTQGYGSRTSEKDGNYAQGGSGNQSEKNGNYTQGRSNDTSEKDGNYAQGRSGNQSEKDGNFTQGYGSRTSEKDVNYAQGGSGNQSEKDGNYTQGGSGNQSEKDENYAQGRSGNKTFERTGNYTQGRSNDTSEKDGNYTQGRSGNQSEKDGNFTQGYGSRTSEKDGNYAQGGSGNQSEKNGNYTQGRSNDTSEKDGNYAQGRSGNQSEKDGNFTQGYGSRTSEKDGNYYTQGIGGNKTFERDGNGTQRKGGSHTSEKNRNFTQGSGENHKFERDENCYNQGSGSRTFERDEDFTQGSDGNVTSEKSSTNKRGGIDTNDRGGNESNKRHIKLNESFI